MKVNSDLEKDGLKGLYGAVRSGLTHEYFIKRISKIEMDNPVQQPITCGITYDPKSNPKIVFCVNQYFRDFKKAFEKYYNQLKNERLLIKLVVNKQYHGKLLTVFRRNLSNVLNYSVQSNLANPYNFLAIKHLISLLHLYVKSKFTE